MFTWGRQTRLKHAAQSTLLEEGWLKFSSQAEGGLSPDARENGAVGLATRLPMGMPGHTTAWMKEGQLDPNSNQAAKVPRVTLSWGHKVIRQA